MFQFPISADEVVDILQLTAYLQIVPLLDLCVSMLKYYLNEGLVELEVFQHMPDELVERCLEEQSVLDLLKFEKPLETSAMNDIWLRRWRTASRDDASLLAVAATDSPQTPIDASLARRLLIEQALNRLIVNGDLELIEKMSAATNIVRRHTIPLHYLARSNRLLRFLKLFLFYFWKN